MSAARGREAAAAGGRRAVAASARHAAAGDAAHQREALDAALAALADPTRRAVVDLLCRRAHRPGEMSETLGLSAPALSRHLRVLKRCGLVIDDEPEDDARVRLYRLQPERFAPLHDWVGGITALWSEQLAAFKAHAERRAHRK